MTVEKDVANAADGILVDANAIRLLNDAFSYFFKENRWSATWGSDIEHNKYVGQVSTSMRALTFKNGDLLSLFDKIGQLRDAIGNTSIKHLFINNHDETANKGTIEGQ